jgi:hypothetical protein
MQLVIFLPTFNALCIRLKIDVIKRVKKLGFFLPTFNALCIRPKIDVIKSEKTWDLKGKRKALATLLVSEGTGPQLQ